MNKYNSNRLHTCEDVLHVSLYRSGVKTKEEKLMCGYSHVIQHCCNKK